VTSTVANDIYLQKAAFTLLCAVTAEHVVTIPQSYVAHYSAVLSSSHSTVVLKTVVSAFTNYCHRIATSTTGRAGNSGKEVVAAGVS